MPPAFGITDGSRVPLAMGVTGTTSLSVIFSTACTSSTVLGRTTMSGIVLGSGSAVPEYVKRIALSVVTFSSPSASMSSLRARSTSLLSTGDVRTCNLEASFRQLVPGTGQYCIPFTASQEGFSKYFWTSGQFLMGWANWWTVPDPYIIEFRCFQGRPDAAKDVPQEEDRRVRRSDGRAVCGLRGALGQELRRNAHRLPHGRRGRPGDNTVPRRVHHLHVLPLHEGLLLAAPQDDLLGLSRPPRQRHAEGPLFFHHRELREGPARGHGRRRRRRGDTRRVLDGRHDHPRVLQALAEAGARDGADQRAVRPRLQRVGEGGGRDHLEPGLPLEPHLAGRVVPPRDSAAHQPAHRQARRAQPDHARRRGDDPLLRVRHQDGLAPRL